MNLVPPVLEEINILAIVVEDLGILEPVAVGIGSEMNPLIGILVNTQPHHHITRGPVGEVHAVAYRGGAVAIMMRLNILETRTMDPRESDAALEAEDLQISNDRSCGILLEQDTSLVARPLDRLTVPIESNPGNDAQPRSGTRSERAHQDMVSDDLVPATTSRCTATIACLDRYRARHKEK